MFSIQNSRQVLRDARSARVNERRDDVDLRPPIINAITTAASRVINRNKRASATPRLLRPPVSLRFNIILSHFAAHSKTEFVAIVVGPGDPHKYAASLGRRISRRRVILLLLLPRLISRRPSTTDESPRRRLSVPLLTSMNCR